MQKIYMKKRRNLKPLRTLDKDFKTSAIKRKLKELIEEINHYYGDDSTVPKDIFDLVQEINEKIKDLEYESEDYYI